MWKFFEEAATLNHPLRLLEEFMKQEDALEQAQQYVEMRFVGYVLEISYDTITVITSDPFKIAVGGIPRNSLLIMVPSYPVDLPPHFTLLRVLEAAPTPLSREVQQTYFELQKRSMPELDIFTQSELQWGALKTAVLGMFYPNPDEDDSVEFSGDINSFISAHKYKVFAPNNDLLDLIINSLVPDSNQFPIGHVRLTECRIGEIIQEQAEVNVYVSTHDFMGARTAMFGKTRLGKSNVVKLIAQSLIETTRETRDVGQLIFDINGEYANDNPQDDNRSLASAFPDQCTVYALTQKSATPSRPLKLNFYEKPASSHHILGSLLDQDNMASSHYIRDFISVALPELDATVQLSPGSERTRAIRKIQIYWAILHKAGFDADTDRLRNRFTGSGPSGFNPGLRDDLRNAIYDSNLPPAPSNLDELVREMEQVAQFRRGNSNSELLRSSSGNPLFDSDDTALLDFLEPQPGRSGTITIRPYRIYHDSQAGNFVTEILDFLEKGSTVILDLGNAHPRVRDYFSEHLSSEVFRHQVNKFSNNRLGNHYIQLYFEEAHNLFPRNEDGRDIYSRFAKEGAKYQIGMVYSTQSPSTISRDLLAQTENFFVAHLASTDDTTALARVNVAYESLKDDILRAKTRGYIRMLTQSHRFVVSVQANRFSPPEH